MSCSRHIKSLTRKLSKIFGDTVKINITSDDINLAEELIQGSTEAAKFVLPYAKSLARQLGLKVNAAVTETSCKKLTRIFEKAIGKYDGDLEAVPDIGRLRLLIEKPEDIKKLRAMFLGSHPRYNGRKGILSNLHPSNKIEVIEFEDFYRKPSSTGRIGIHITLNVTIPGKQVVPVEIQVLHKDMKRTEDFTRENYLDAQKIRRQAISENRVLTPDEKQSIEHYDASSRKKYTGDALQYKLYDLRQQYLIQRANIDHLKPVAA